MAVKFDYEEEKSDLFGTLKRPVANVHIQNAKTEDWEVVKMLVDSGADYTLFPFWYTAIFGLDLAEDCRKVVTSGVGGDAVVYLAKESPTLKIGEWERKAPVGFLESVEIPPILGRHGLLDTFSVTLANPHTYFTQGAPRFDR